MNSSDKKYKEWCKRIAELEEMDKLISHFQEHVCAHYSRHNHEGELGLRIWFASVFNFMHIFEEKFKGLTIDDLMFKLCAYHMDHNRCRPKPPLDVDEFMKMYESDIKNYYYEHKRDKKSN